MGIMSINPNLIKKHKKKFTKYLEDRRTDTSEYTHLSMGGLHPPGKFNITTKKEVKKLNKLLAEAFDLGLNYSILEKRKQYGPVIIDIDLEKPQDETKEKRLYDEKMIKKVCE